MKRLLILLVLALPAYGQIINPGIPCSGGNCTVSGDLNVTGAAYVGLGTPNDTSTGTVKLQGAKHENVAGVDRLVNCGTTDTQVPCFPVVKGAGTTGNAYVQTSGTLAVPFDNTSVVGDCVVASITSGGQYHDTGSVSCGSSWGLGYATTAGTGNQTVLITPVLPPVLSIQNNGTGVTPTAGAVNLVPGTGITLTTSGNGVTVAATSGFTGFATFPLTNSTNALTVTTQNHTKLWGYVSQSTYTSSGFCISIATADNSTNVYDIGVYNGAGTLLGHTGAIAGNGALLGGTAGLKCGNWLASFTVPAKMYLALTSSAASPLLAFGGVTSGWEQFASAVAPSSEVVTSGGVLNSSLTPPADSWASAQNVQFYLHQ